MYPRRPRGLADSSKIYTDRILDERDVPRLLRQLRLPTSRFIGSFNQIPRFSLDQTPRFKLDDPEH